MQDIQQGNKEVEQGITLIKEWMDQLPYLPDPNDALLRRFYRGCKYSIERSKQVLELYYSVRRAIPDFFTNRDPTSEEMKSIRNSWHLFFLPQKSAAGNEIFISRLRNPGIPYMVECYGKHTMMMVDISLQEQENYVGTEIVYDLLHYDMRIVSTFTLAFQKKYILCTQDAAPLRIKRIHFVNAPRYADVILSLAKPLLKRKIRERVVVHSAGAESLHKYFSKDILPKEYGGCGESFEKLNELAEKKLLSYRDFFLSEEKKLLDLPPRSRRFEVENDMLGLQGSFRKVTVD